MSQSKSGSGAAGAERRKTRRRSIVDSFSIFAVVPKKGMHRLAVHDVSDQGIGFNLDTEGESFEHFPIKRGETLELHLYLNQSLSIPLSVGIARIEQDKSVRRVGAEIQDRTSSGSKAFLAFIQLIDSIAEL